MTYLSRNTCCLYIFISKGKLLTRYLFSPWLCERETQNGNLWNRTKNKLGHQDNHTLWSWCPDLLLKAKERTSRFPSSVIPWEFSQCTGNVEYKETILIHERELYISTFQKMNVLFFNSHTISPFGSLMTMTGKLGLEFYRQDHFDSQGSLVFAKFWKIKKQNLTFWNNC